MVELKYETHPLIAETRDPVVVLGIDIQIAIEHLPPVGAQAPHDVKERAFPDA